MPPLSTHKTLSDAQKLTIKLWIEQGAQWKEHWAFVAPARAPLPVVSDRKWSRNPIDRFVLAKIETAGLAPNPEADRRALMRRVALDLTGLPPKPEDVDAFVADTSPDAYEKVVAKLLASPHYGEHRARYWLDAARYGDTNGLHYDNYRGGSGPTATGLSERSTATCRSTGSRSSSLPATCCRIRRSTSSSRPGFVAQQRDDERERRRSKRRCASST